MKEAALVDLLFLADLEVLTLMVCAHLDGLVVDHALLEVLPGGLLAALVVPLADPDQ